MSQQHKKELVLIHLVDKGKHTVAPGFGDIQKRMTLNMETTLSTLTIQLNSSPAESTGCTIILKEAIIDSMLLIPAITSSPVHKHMHA
jgi:predicted ABC-type ATPase